MRSTFNILFYINKQKIRKNGKCPVMCRITVDGGIAQFSIKEEVSPLLWSVEEGRSSGKDKPDKALNQKLEACRNELKKHYHRLIEKESCVTAERLKNAFLGGESQAPMLLAGFKAHNEEYLKSAGITKSRGSYDGYDQAYKALKKFIIQKYEPGDIAFDDLQPSFIRDFEFFLKVDLGYAPSTVFNVVMKLKRMVRKAINQGIIRKNPFASFPCSPGDTTRKWLSKTDLDAILNATQKDKNVEYMRLMFIFAAFTGLSFSDLRNLRNKDISTDGRGMVWIRIRRQKTGTQAVVPLLEIPLAIYNKYRNADMNAKAKVFSVPSYPLARIYLEKLRVAIKLDVLKFHMSRHSFSTTVCLSNGIPIETLSRMLGHKNISTTQIYAKITHQKVEEDMQVLEKRLGNKYMFPETQGKTGTNTNKLNGLKQEAV